jgi:hypothetical protein
MIASFHFKKSGRSSIGRPRSLRNTVVGSGTANSVLNSHSPRSANTSMISLVSAVTSRSSFAISRGAKSGSRSLRYSLCFGGSIWSGMSGRSLPRPTLSPQSDVKTSGWRSAYSTRSWRATATLPSVANTGHDSSTLR